MEELHETLKFLIEYPTEEMPYPDNYPEDLKYDPYPGKDFVIGVCDEAIEKALQLYPASKHKDAMKIWTKCLKLVRDYRVKLLSDKGKPPEPKIANTITQEIINQTLF